MNMHAGIMRVVKGCGNDAANRYDKMKSQYGYVRVLEYRFAS